MFIQAYQLDELEFAWCYRVYYRWRTHRAVSRAELASLDRATLDSLLQPYGIHVLEASASTTDVRVLASLPPAETVAACAGKAKGRVSKWLREKLRLAGPETLLGRGYFACTAGPSAAQTVERYLGQQGEHMGMRRVQDRRCSLGAIPSLQPTKNAWALSTP